MAKLTSEQIVTIAVRESVAIRLLPGLLREHAKRGLRRLEVLTPPGDPVGTGGPELVPERESEPERITGRQ